MGFVSLLVAIASEFDLALFCLFFFSIRTLGDFRGESSHDSGEESGGEGQEFYVGGSEHRFVSWT